MNTLTQTEPSTLIRELAEKSSIPEEEIRTKMNEKIQKFSGLLTEQGALILLSREMNVKLPLFEKQNPLIRLGELKEGMNNVDVICTIKMIDRIKTFSKNGKEGKYLSTRLMDETGEALFTFWNEQAEEAVKKGLTEGNTLMLKNARTGSYNGRIQLSLGYNGTYSIEAGKGTPIPTEKQEKIAFSALTENGSFEGEASIVDVLPGKGYYVRCTACQAKLPYRDTVCPQCGKEGSVEARLLISLLLDDGTTTLRGVAFENEAAALMGKGKEEILAQMDDEKQKTALWQEMRGKRIRVRGRGKRGMDASSIELILQGVQTIPFNHP